MFKKLHLTPPTLRFGLSSGPPINLRTPPPDNYCTVPYSEQGKNYLLKINDSIQINPFLSVVPTI